MNNFSLTLILKPWRFKVVRELVVSVSSENNQKSWFPSFALLTLGRAAASQSSSVAFRSQSVCRAMTLSISLIPMMGSHSTPLSRDALPVAAGPAFSFAETGCHHSSSLRHQPN
jgi:hypothetical protein